MPFDLGRPLGTANDPEFQSRVLMQALKLLEAPTGPILESFPDDAPEEVAPPEPVACPVNFKKQKGNISSTEQMLNDFLAEVSQIRVWYDLACEERGRTTFGVTGLDPDEVAGLMAAFVRGQSMQAMLPEASPADAVRMAAEDIKAVYLEAVSALPGQCVDHESLANWFWGETMSAEVINTIRKMCLQSDDASLVLLGKLMLVPRNQLHRFEG